MRFPALAALPLALLVSGCTETSSLRSGDLAVNRNVISVTPANLAKKPVRSSIQIPRFPSGLLTVETDTISGITFQGVSFDARDYRLAVIDQPGGPGSKYPDARSAAASRDGLAAVNAGFFTPEGAPLGRVISGGKAAGSWNRSSLGSGVFTESPSGHLAISRRAAVPSDTSSRELLQAGPLLVENGRSVSGLNGGKPAVRTLMLWDGGNRWWVGKSSVCTLAKLGAALGDGSPTDWKIHTALNLDGGRSTDLWVSASVSGGPASFRPLWNRPVRNFLVLVPRPPLTVTFPLQNQWMDTGCGLCYGSFHQPMKAKSPAIHLLAAAFLPLAISSCGTMKVVQAAKEKTTNGMSAIADASWGRFTKPKVQVVEVREKDLKDMPTGEERALAYQNQRKRSFWNFFSGPVDFKEPTLPSSAGELDGSLLPPVE